LDIIVIATGPTCLPALALRIRNAIIQIFLGLLVEYIGFILAQSSCCLLLSSHLFSCILGVYVWVAEFVCGAAAAILLATRRLHAHFPRLFLDFSPRFDRRPQGLRVI